MKVIEHVVEMQCSAAVAFETFFGDFATWWPIEMFSGSALRGHSPGQISVSLCIDGRITESNDQGFELEWGHFREVVSGKSALLDFHISKGNSDSAARTILKLNFEDRPEQGSCLRLTQTNFEAFGDMADDLVIGYGHAWPNILENCYVTACNAKSLPAK